MELRRCDFVNQYGRDLDSRGRYYLNSVWGTVKHALFLKATITDVKFTSKTDGPWDIENFIVGFDFQGHDFYIRILKKTTNSIDTGRYTGTDIELYKEAVLYGEYTNMGELQAGIGNLISSYPVKEIV